MRLILLFSVTLIFSCTTKNKESKESPNFVLFLVDDQGWSGTSVQSYTPKKVLIKCYVESNNKVTAEAEVVAFRVFDSSNTSKNLFSN